MTKKYELTTETKVVDGKTLYRIKALIAFRDVHAGDVGGFVESDTNLSHDGNAWVYDNAWVSGNAWVYGNAKVYDNAKVSGNAEVSANAIATKAVLNVGYEMYNITATDNHLKIGCKQYTFDEWANFDDGTISRMADGALVWWKKWKPIIFAILEVKV